MWTRHIKKKARSAVQKQEVTSLEVKVDSYVIETNIHFPTDINLTWDCARKCLDMIDHISNEVGCISGWREKKSIRAKVRKSYYKTAEIHRKKGKDYASRLKKATVEYLEKCTNLREKVKDTLGDKSIIHTLKSMLCLQELARYKALLDKHIDLTNRRIIQEQKIPHHEKMFSIFEPHTEWLNKGKMHKNVELGLNTLIATDQHHFILHHHVLLHQVDVHTSMPTATNIKNRYSDGYKMKSISFDRNYYSKNGKQQIGKIFNLVVMPKPGKKSKVTKMEESDIQFQKLRKKHSAVESNINQLEHNGLNRCPDKGIGGFKRYVALGVMAYNLHRLGKVLRK